jgi:hypothetical protein
VLEAGYEFLKYMPQEYVDEIHGIADGSGMPFDEILILNTFFDTLMGFRSITFFIKLIQGPALWKWAGTATWTLTEWTTTATAMSTNPARDGFRNTIPLLRDDDRSAARRRDPLHHRRRQERHRSGFRPRSSE